MARSSTSPANTKPSPCQELWARYYESTIEGKIKILKELDSHGCLEENEPKDVPPDIVA